MNIDEWNRRFEAQLAWTRHARNHLYRKLDFAGRRTFLEIGCGTGALLQEVHERFVAGARGRVIHGIDREPAMVARARQRFENEKNVHLQVGRAEDTGFEQGFFDVVFCSYFFMWNDDEAKKKIIHEVMRILKPGGVFACFAEPDYTRRVDEPDGRLARLLEVAVDSAGGDPASGAKLPYLLAPFPTREIWNVSRPWDASRWKANFKEEWDFFRKTIPEDACPATELDRLQRDEWKWVLNGEKFTIMPVYMGFGRKMG